MTNPAPGNRRGRDAFAFRRSPCRVIARSEATQQSVLLCSGPCGVLSAGCSAGWRGGFARQGTQALPYRQFFRHTPRRGGALPRPSACIFGQGRTLPLRTLPENCPHSRRAGPMCPVLRQSASIRPFDMLNPRLRQRRGRGFSHTYTIPPGLIPASGTPGRPLFRRPGRHAPR